MKKSLFILCLLIFFSSSCQTPISPSESRAWQIADSLTQCTARVTEIRLKTKALYQRYYELGICAPAYSWRSEERRYRRYQKIDYDFDMRPRNNAEGERGLDACRLAMEDALVAYRQAKRQCRR